MWLFKRCLGTEYVLFKNYISEYTCSDFMLLGDLLSSKISAVSSFHIMRLNYAHCQFLLIFRNIIVGWIQPTFSFSFTQFSFLQPLFHMDFAGIMILTIVFCFVFYCSKASWIQSSIFTLYIFTFLSQLKGYILFYNVGKHFNRFPGSTKVVMNK